MAYSSDTNSDIIVPKKWYDKLPREEWSKHEKVDQPDPWKVECGKLARRAAEVLAQHCGLYMVRRQGINQLTCLEAITRFIKFEHRRFDTIQLTSHDARSHGSRIVPRRMRL